MDGSLLIFNEEAPQTNENCERNAIEEEKKFGCGDFFLAFLKQNDVVLDVVDGLLLCQFFAFHLADLKFSAKLVGHQTVVECFVFGLCGGGLLWLPLSFLSVIYNL
jgi:hypothetical protein